MPNYKRQEGIFNPVDYEQTVSLVGCGSVGSFTAMALAKMGVRVEEVFDSDIVEEHNLPNQFFKPAYLNAAKPIALAKELKDFGLNEPAQYGNVKEETVLRGDIVISAVDSMKTRKLIWERVKESLPELYIDSRMGGKLFSIHTVDMSNPKAMKAYKKTLVDDSDTLDIPCTERTIIFNVLGVASFICNQVVNFLTEKPITPEIHFDYDAYRCTCLD